MTLVAASPPNSKRSPGGSPTGGCAADATSPGMADRQQRAAAYVRESTEEQGQGFSPDAQREGIRRFAPENNLELVGEYCDFHSGWRKSEARPEFQRLMADAAAGKFDVVLVFHTSRFARNQVEARRYKQLLRERLGIRVVSVTQPMGEGHTDPSAFLAESIHEMFDEYYSSRCPSGHAADSRRRHAKGISSAASRGATCATPTASSPSRTPSARRSCSLCSSVTPPAKSQTAPSRRG